MVFGCRCGQSQERHLYVVGVVAIVVPEWCSILRRDKCKMCRTTSEAVQAENQHGTSLVKKGCKYVAFNRSDVSTGLILLTGI